MTEVRKYWFELREINGERLKTVVICNGPGAYDIRDRLKARGFKYGFTYDDFLMVSKRLPKEEKVNSDVIERYLGKQAKRWSITLDGTPALNGAAIVDLCRELNAPCPSIPGYDPDAAPAASDETEDEEMPF